MDLRPSRSPASSTTSPEAQPHSGEKKTLTTQSIPLTKGKSLKPRGIRVPPLTQTTLTNTLLHALQVPSLKDNKDECILDLIVPEKDYWNGTEAGRLKDYRFPDTCSGGDGSNHEATKTMGDRFCTLKELHWDRRDILSSNQKAQHEGRY